MIISKDQYILFFVYEVFFLGGGSKLGRVILKRRKDWILQGGGAGICMYACVRIENLPG